MKLLSGTAPGVRETLAISLYATLLRLILLKREPSSRTIWVSKTGLPRELDETKALADVDVELNAVEVK